MFVLFESYAVLCHYVVLTSIHFWTPIYFRSKTLNIFVIEFELSKKLFPDIAAFNHY